MRIVALLIALASPSGAELLAHFQTTQGTVTVALQYEKTPQTVANFITLTQGTRDRLDVVTGAISRKPFYIGEKFFRVVNEPAFKIAQTGSGNGTNIGGGPGYTFKDEFDNTLLHLPYVLSMANSGPNTNGSQIFLTGNATIPSLDFVHTVFGLVTDPASRSVVDAIHASGDDGTTILNVTFSRTSPTAQGFNEFAQNLPFVRVPAGKLSVLRGLSATWNFNAPMTGGDVLRAYRSTTLASNSWSALFNARLHVGITEPSSPSTILSRLLDNASNESAFYNISVTSHPDSFTPTTLANRTVTIPLGSNTLTYAFNSSGTAGTTTYMPAEGDPLVGAFTTVNPSTLQPMAPQFNIYDFSFTADTPAIIPRYLWVEATCDTADDEKIDGDQILGYLDQFLVWQLFASGPITITR